MLQTEYTLHAVGPIYQDALSIRRAVFIEEQNIPETIEISEEEALYFVLYNENTPLATCRLKPLSNHEVKLQRMAVASDGRGKQLGSKLLNDALKEAAKLGYSSVTLGAQKKAVPFYEKNGFTINSSEFIEAGIPHYTMTKKI